MMLIPDLNTEPYNLPNTEPYTDRTPNPTNHQPKHPTLHQALVTTDLNTQPHRTCTLNPANHQSEHPAQQAVQHGVLYQLCQLTTNHNNQPYTQLW